MRLRHRAVPTAGSETPELRVVGITAGPDATTVEVLVTETPALAALAPAWAGARVTVGAHLLDGTGAVVRWEGPRSQPLDLAALGGPPLRRSLRFAAELFPAGADAVASLELVAEGRGWAGDAGLEALVVGVPRPAGRADDLPAPGATDELRLVGAELDAGRVILHVEVSASEVLSGLAAGAWAGAAVFVGSHWVEREGAVVQWEGPRSDPLPLEWLGLVPEVRALDVSGGPASSLVLELVADVAERGWGSAAGLDPLTIDVGALVAASTTARLAVPRARIRAAVPAPAEPLAPLREWLQREWPALVEPDEMRQYLDRDFARLVLTAVLVGLEPAPRVLEIGANPYFLSRLLRRWSPECGLTLTNWFGPSPGYERAAAGAPFVEVLVDASDREVEKMCSDIVDIEAGALPYEDASFDGVVFGEVVEHLVADPAVALREIHRVLAPGGRMILTTPNVARPWARHRLAQRQGIGDPYSHYGPHGRHNREYVAGELFDLVSGNGFRVESYLSRPVHGVGVPEPAWFEAADDDGFGDFHFLVCRRTDADPPAEPYRPAWLYR